MDPGPVGFGNASGVGDTSVRLIGVDMNTVSNTKPYLGSPTEQPNNLTTYGLDQHAQSVIITSDASNPFNTGDALIFYGFSNQVINDQSDGSVSDKTFVGGIGIMGVGGGAGEAYRCPGGFVCGIDFSWTKASNAYRAVTCQRDYALGTSSLSKTSPSFRFPLDAVATQVKTGIQTVISTPLVQNKLDGATLSVASVQVVPVSWAIAKQLYDSSPAHNVGPNTTTPIWYNDWYTDLLRVHVALKVSKSGLSDAPAYFDLYIIPQLNRHDGQAPIPKANRTFSPWQDQGHALPSVGFVPEFPVILTLMSTPSQSSWGDFACSFGDVLSFLAGQDDSYCMSDEQIYDDFYDAVADNNRNTMQFSTQLWETAGAVWCTVFGGTTCGSNPWDHAAAGLRWLACGGNGTPACLWPVTNTTFPPRLTVQANFSSIPDSSFDSAVPSVPKGIVSTLPESSGSNAEPTYLHFDANDSSKWQMILNAIDW